MVKLLEHKCTKDRIRLMITLLFNLMTLCLPSASLFSQSALGKQLELPDFHHRQSEQQSIWVNSLPTSTRLNWRFKTNGQLVSSPILYKGILYVGSNDGHLYALNGKTGRLNWKFKTGGAVSSSPATDGKYVYFGSMDGYYYALDLQGKIVWKFATAGEKRIGAKGYGGMQPDSMYMEDLWDYFLSSPIVQKIKDTTYVFFGSSDANLYCVNAATGQLKWHYKTKGPIHTTPVIANGVLYFGGWDTYLYALNVNTGQLLWQFKTGDKPFMRGIQSSPVVSNGMVYFGARDAHVYALNAQNGHLIWAHPTANSWVLTTVAVGDSLVFAGTSDTYLLLALDKDTGEEKWHFKSRGYVYSSPVIAGEQVVFGDYTGNLYVVDIRSNGKKFIKYPTPSRQNSAGTILNMDTLDFKFAANGADLYLYKTNQKVMESFDQLGGIVCSVLLHNRKVYFGANDGYIYSVELK